EMSDRSTDNPIDDARAHRAIIVDDFIAVGFSYTPDQAIARFTVEENYDFYLRRSKDGGKTWDTQRNLSKLPKDRSVKEPRLVGTPGSVSATCPSGDPKAEDTTNVHDCQRKELFYVAWGTELNQRESISEGAIDLDLYISRSLNFGETYEVPVVVARGGIDLENGGSSNGESQIRMTPDGWYSYTTWMQATDEGKEVAFVSGDWVDTSGGGGFCSYNLKGRFDPVLPAILMIALGYVGWRKMTGTKE
ncbi:MAG: choice-of-anchor O protein, partial [Gammaproteobacteria bacterium]|nr:choice-of-anchor O protein [Gammaproteobacteria bacterium]